MSHIIKGTYYLFYSKLKQAIKHGNYFTPFEKSLKKFEDRQITYGIVESTKKQMAIMTSQVNNTTKLNLIICYATLKLPKVRKPNG